MKEYLSYKPSRMNWLQQIPASWEERRAKFFFKEVNSRSETGEEELLSVSHITGVTPRSEKNIYMFMAASYVGHKLCEAGDLVINSLWTWMGALGVAWQTGIVSSAYGVYRLKRRELFNRKYLDYLLRTDGYKGEYICRSTGIWTSRLGLNTEDFFDIPIICPPIEDQNAIVAYLDSKLTDIDRYIAEKERLIELLTEQKTALINQTVTRGLNPKVRMKSSGIEGVGEIPEHWEVKRNKLIFREIKDRSATGNETRLSMSQKYGLVASDTLEEKTLQSESSEGFKVCQVNDLVLNRLKAHLGVFARSIIPGSVSPDYTVLRLTTNADVRYFEYLFRHPAYIGWFNKVVRGIIAGFWRLYTQDFLNITSIFPPPEEQSEIVEYIIAETDKIKQSIETLEKEISLMQEYRTALIAEAVTGKIDVR